MPDAPTTNQANEKPHFIPRSEELEELATTLPLKGVEIGDNRIFNIWGEAGVGKSSFISEFRESKRMRKEKVLWIHPTRDEPLDDIPEFIRACSKSIRYPAQPGKEKRISEQLESVQRGKVNPIVSDDSILITRSSIAKQKKAYINQAAASSVGRTENVRDDFDINVGLGESKANNHAEGFLDALPLKALGTDLTIIYIEHYDRLSITIMDWLRDYVFPAASHGAYRRSLVFLFESKDPIRFAYPLESWGEWSNSTEDFRLFPLTNADAYRTAIALGASSQEAGYLQHRSLGYPGQLHSYAKSLATLKLGPANQFLDSLTNEEQLKIAVLSLPNSIHVEDMTILFGSEANRIFDWAKSHPSQIASAGPNGKTLSLNEALRCAAISRFAQHPQFLSSADIWQPMGRIIRNVTSRNERAKLFLLAGLLWIDSRLCTSLFKEQSSKIVPFILESKTVFNQQRNQYCISERLRPDLQKAAIAMKHPGIGIVFRKAKNLWEERIERIKEQTETIESQIEEHQKSLDELARRQSETIAQIRIHERTTEPTKREEGIFSKILHLNQDVDENSPAELKKRNKTISIQIHEKEQRIDEFKLELEVIQDELKHPYVPSSLK